jgi:hypothetical protein
LLAFCAVRGLCAADFTVTNTNSSGPGSLYQAIIDANTTPGADRILFNIPGAGVHKIDVNQNPLPTVVESLVIDGYTQPGAKVNSLSTGDNAVILIQVDGGSGAGSHTGLLFNPGSGSAPSNYTVRGLCLTGFGTTNGSASGIAITAGVVDSLVVTGNFIGILPDGETAKGNWIGVGHVTQLGGVDPASRNIISGNTVGFSGELATGAGPAAATVQGNYLGTNASGTKAVPNIAAAISLDSTVTTHCETAQFDLSNTRIGGSTAGAGNLISGNPAAITLGGFCSLHGLPVAWTGVNGVRIEGNWIGVSSADINAAPGGSSALPNGSSITIRVGSNNIITRNKIKFNDSGVVVMSGTANQISQNAIYLNRGVGIDLGGDGVTANDTNDVDDGPNNFQNFPIITSASVTQADRFGIDWRSAASGTLQSTPNATFLIEVFASVFAGPLGNGEAEVGLGTVNVTTDANGNASFSVSQVWGFPGARAFSATATDSSGNTSEFSPAFFPAAQLLNLSTRTAVGAGENVLIGGFIVAGTEDKKVLLRGLGPSLTQAGVSGALVNPTLELRDATGTLIVSNDNWKDTQETEISQTGIAPPNELEAAILATLPAKPANQGGTVYTAILAGNNGQSGVGLLEIYDLGAGANSKLTNISTRGFVGAGEGVLIGGLIPGPTGNSAIRVLIRGIGPSLSAHGVSAPLADPVLELHDANGATVVKNDNWGEAYNAAEISTTGLEPTDSRESAILTGLFPASGYTAIVRGANGGTGIALVEVYALN